MKVICILGMHRSGTSCLTGTLQSAGLYLGDVSLQNKNNPKGNRENYVIMGLHNELLQANGGSWNNPPERVVWSGPFKERRDRIIASYIDTGKTCWGFKDPRTLLCLDEWLNKLNDFAEVQLVGTVRHPLAVAKSLYNRTQMPVQQALQLWRIYNERLMHYYKQFHFPLLSFDQSADELSQGLTRICEHLGFEDSSSSNQLQFFNDGLRHHQSNSLSQVEAAELSEVIPSDVLVLYERLRAEAQF